MNDTPTYLNALRRHGFIADPVTRTMTTVNPVVVRDDSNAARYLETAVANEVEKVRTTAEGSRNWNLYIAAFSLGQLVEGAGLSRPLVEERLTAAALAAGLTPSETRSTIKSGIEGGAEQPRNVPELRVLDVPPATVFEVEEQGVEEIRAFIDEHLPRLDWHALWADETEEEWIVEPILPARRLIALYSAPKVGKSLLMLEIAVAVAMGREVMGVIPDPRRVLYVDFENDPKADIRERLQAMHVGPDDLHRLDYLSFPSLSALDSDGGGKQLMAAVRHYGSELVVVDTVSRAIAGEENENDTWLSFYRHTGLRLKKAGIALVRLDHSGKDETKGQRGGSAKSGDVDAVWRLSRLTDETYRLDCEAARMPVTERTLVIHRDASPLRHRVEGRGTGAVQSVKVDAIIHALDEAQYDIDGGKPRARELLKSLGMATSDKALTEAIRRRKSRGHQTSWMDDK